MLVEIIREEPTPPPVKEVVLRCTPEEAKTIEGLLAGLDWYHETLLPGHKKNAMHGVLAYQLKTSGVGLSQD